MGDGQIYYRENDGTRTAVSPSKPLPTTATISGGGDASAAKQDAQTALLTSIDASNTAIQAAVEATTPVSTKEGAFTDVVTMVEDTVLTPAAEGVLVVCTTAGTVTFANVGADSFTLSFAVGTSKIEGIEIAQFTAVGGGFVGTIYGLRRT